MENRSKGLIGLIVLVLTIALLGVFVGRWSAGGVHPEGEIYENLKIFTEALSLVQKNYVEEVDPKELVRGAIKGMLSSLDPHSSFMTPETYKEMQIDTKGEFGGIGIQIGIKDGQLTVIAPIEGTPADRAGIKAGDKIVKINGEFTKDMSIQDAVKKMRGPKGTTVTITIIREGLKETKEFTIVRDIIKIQSVRSKMLDDGIGYIRISQFQEQTAADLSDALKSLEKEKANSLILDLRNNPGGLLNSAVDVSGEFLPPGKTVVSIKARNGEKSEYVTDDRRPYYSLPMIILVNEGSASASEIVAGAMQDWGRAVILGAPTFGKGSVQTVIPLSDGSGLRLTTAKYFTPKGKSIQNVGITPDIVVKTNLPKEHPLIREKDLERHLKNEEVKEEETEKRQPEEGVGIEVGDKEGKEDIQLQRAIDVLKGWRIFKQIKEKY